MPFEPPPLDTIEEESFTPPPLDSIEGFAPPPVESEGELFQDRQLTPLENQLGFGQRPIDSSIAEAAIPGVFSDMASGEGPGAFETAMQPIIEIPAIPAKFMQGIISPLLPGEMGAQIAEGAGKFVSDVVSSLTSPGMMMLGGIGAVAPRAAAVAIAGLGIHGLAPSMKEAIEASERGDLSGFTQAALNASMAGVMTSAGARGVVKKALLPLSDKAAKEVVEKPPILPEEVPPMPEASTPAPSPEPARTPIKANADMLEILEPAKDKKLAPIGSPEADISLASETDQSIILRTKDSVERANAFEQRDAAAQRLITRQPETPPETKGAPAPEIIPEPEPKPESLVDDTLPVMVPVDKLTISQDVPQFKAGANEKGIVRPLGGTFDPIGVAPVQVWERLDGRQEVISGRHRLDLAQRSGTKEISAQIHREADGFTVANAARLDAVLNIRDGQGTISDYARFFKYTDPQFTEASAKSEGLLADAKGKAGFVIGTQASPDLFALHQAEKIADAQAAAIATVAPNDPGLQALGVRMALDGRSAEAVADVMRLAKQRSDISKSAADQGSLFDFDDSAIREMEQQSALAAKERKEIRAQVNTVKGAAKKPEIAKEFGIDVSDPAGVRNKVAELEARLILLKEHPELAGTLPTPQALPQPSPAAPIATVEAPKLRAGEKGTGDMFQGADAPFNLAGETQVDPARVAAEKAKAQSDAADAKRLADEQQQGFIGMGGAVPSEFGPTGGGSPTAGKYKLIDSERAKRGLDPLIKPEGLTDQQALDKAMATQDMDPLYVDNLIKSIKENPRVIEDWQNHALVLRKIDLSIELDRSIREGQQAYKDGRLDDVAAITPRTQIWSERLTEVEEALRLSGAKRGSALRSLRVMINDDFSLAKMKMQRAADRKFEPLSPEEAVKEDTELIRIADEYKATADKFQARVAELEAQKAQAELDKSIAEAKAEVAKQPTFAPAVLEAAERIVSGWEKRAELASKQLREDLDALQKLGVKPQPTDPALVPRIVLKMAEIGLAKLGRSALNLAKFTETMISEYGPRVEPFLKDAFEAAQKLLTIESDKIKGPISEQVKRKIKNVDVAEKITDAKEKIGVKFEQGEETNVTPSVRKLVRALVEQNPRITRDALVDTVHDVLKEFVPEMTRIEAMDAISGRGKFWIPPQDVVSKTVRDLSTQIRLVAHQQDVLAKKPLPRTGYQPEPLSDAARQEVQKLNDLKRQYGVVVTDPDAQLGSTLAARKTYYTHRLADLRQEIKSGERIVKGKSPSPTDPALEALKSEYNAVKAEHDAIFGTREMTDDQRVKLAIGAVERSITDLEARIKGGDIGPRSRASKTPNTSELESARARRDALREELQELRDLDQGINQAKADAARERQIKAIEKEAAEVQAKISSGDLSKTPNTPRQNRPLSPEIEQARQRLEVLNKQLAELRKSDPVRLAKIETARFEAEKKAIEKAIVESERKLREGDLKGPGPQMNRPARPEIEQLKQRRDAVNAELAQARKDARPRKSSEEIALQSLKARLTRENANLRDRIARGDFSPKPKASPIDISKDTQAMTLAAENEQVKAQYARSRAKDQAARMTLGQKTWANVKETVNLHRNYITAFDLPPVFRQGGFISLGNPSRAALNLARSLKAISSEKTALRIEQEILHRPNATLYARFKLELPSFHEGRISAQEEMTMSRLGQKIPGLRASNRGFITFLNLMRADTFDAMIKNMAKDPRNPTAIEGNATSNYINVTTGRGPLGRAAPAAELLSTAFFAPRLLVSRIQLLAGQPIYRGNLRTRSLIALEYGKMLTGGSAIMGLALLAGAEIETDPRSSDFLKLKFGHTRLDPLMGLQQVTVLLAREFGRHTKSLRTGKVSPIFGDKVPYGGETGGKIATRFLRTKISPSLGLGWDIWTGENVVGDKVTPSSAAQNALIPISYQDIYTVMKDQGVPEGTALQMLNFLGMGLQHFDEKKRR